MMVNLGLRIAIFTAMMFVAGCVSGKIDFSLGVGPDGKLAPKLGGTVIFGERDASTALKPEAGL